MANGRAKKSGASGAVSRRKAEPVEESVTERVLGAVDADAADLLRGYLEEPLASTDLLTDHLDIYYKQLESRANEGAVFDLDLAEELARSCGRMLTLVDDDTPLEHRMLVQAAVRYFIEDEDADDDTDSLVGFDDDASVIEAVAVAIGRADVLEDDSA